MTPNLEICDKCKHSSIDGFYFKDGKVIETSRVCLISLPAEINNYFNLMLYRIENCEKVSNTNFIIPECCPYLLEHTVQKANVK